MKIRLISCWIWIRWNISSIFIFINFHWHHYCSITPLPLVQSHREWTLPDKGWQGLPWPLVILITIIFTYSSSTHSSSSKPQALNNPRGDPTTAALLPFFLPPLFIMVMMVVMSITMIIMMMTRMMMMMMMMMEVMVMEGSCKTHHCSIWVSATNPDLSSSSTSKRVLRSTRQKILSQFLGGTYLIAWWGGRGVFPNDDDMTKQGHQELSRAISH